MKKCKILGVNIDCVNMDTTLMFIDEELNNLRGKYICVSNVHTTVMSYDNEEYKQIQNNAIMALPDGKPLSIIGKIRGSKDIERVTGPDLMEEIFKISSKKNYSHFFYGSTKETLEKLKQELYKKYPSINVCGVYSPPFRELSSKENDEIIENINKLNPDFVWVGLGAPKQEVWMSKNSKKINSLMIGVGAGFDYHAKNIKRAPRIMQNLGLEWLYRLKQDPKRLWKRYMFTNFKFIYLNLIGK